MAKLLEKLGIGFVGAAAPAAGAAAEPQLLYSGFRSRAGPLGEPPCAGNAAKATEAAGAAAKKPAKEKKHRAATTKGKVAVAAVADKPAVVAQREVEEAPAPAPAPAPAQEVHAKAKTGKAAKAAERKDAPAPAHMLREERTGGLGKAMKGKGKAALADKTAVEEQAAPQEEAPAPPSLPPPPPPPPPGKQRVRVFVPGVADARLPSYRADHKNASLHALLGVCMRAVNLDKQRAALGWVEGAGVESCYYLSRLRPTEERIARLLAERRDTLSACLDVDHTYEVQLLTHALLQTRELHGVLCKIQFDQGEDTKGGVVYRTVGERALVSLERQEKSVKALLQPIYDLQNGLDAQHSLFNLRLLLRSINRGKCAPFGAYIDAARAGRAFSVAEDMVQLFSVRSKAEHGTAIFLNKPEECQLFCGELLRELRDTTDAYAHILQGRSVSQYEALGETIGDFTAYVEDEVGRLRADK
jgi:hypothetical protein